MKYLLLIPVLLTGCATQDYSKYTESLVAIETAKHNADAEKYRAMAQIAQSGDTTTKVAAMFSLQGNSQQHSVSIVAPKSPWDTARDLLGIFIPAVVQGYGIKANQNIAVTQSNNSRDVAVSTNSAFVGIASQIQAPSTISVTSGVFGSGSISPTSTTDNHSIQGVTK